MPFEFSDEKRTVIRLKQGDVQACYHLSKGASNWILRRHGTGTAYQPGLLDLDPDTTIVLEELNLDQVQQRTGQPAKTVSVVTSSGTWDQILAELDTDGSNAAGASLPPVSLVEPAGVRVPASRIIPATDMRHLYLMLKDFNSIEVHAALAHETEREAVTQRLARRFRTSVEQFSVYCNEEPFYPEIRSDLPEPTDIQKIGTPQLTNLLCRQCNNIGEVENAPELSFTYVDREIISSRTTGGAIFSDGRPAIAGKRLDWLLANKADRCPIIAEVKIGNDMNPFYALVQMLMYAAELVSLNQAKRLLRHYGQFQISGIDGPGEDDLPSVDLYLILCRYDWSKQDRKALFDATKRICERLMKEQAVASHVRRIACLEAKVSESGQLSFHKLFCSSRPAT